LETGRSKSKRARKAISKAVLAQIAVGGLSIVGASSAFATIAEGVATGANSVAIGTASETDVANGVAIGNAASALTDDDNPTQTGGVALGGNAQASGSGVAIGTNTQAGSGSFALGSGAVATSNSIAIGPNARSFNQSAVALGDTASAAASKSMALGANTVATGNNSVALGSGAVASRANTVSVGSASAMRQIVNVANGVQANDAVNVSQLQALGAVIDPSGTVTGSFVSYDGTTKGAVTLGGKGSTTPVALMNVAAGMGPTDAVNVKQLTDAGLTLGTSGQVTNAFVSYDDSSKGAVTLGGKGSTTPVKLSNVADGVADSDAATVGQMNALEGTFSTVQSSIKYIRFGSSVAAAAQASATDAVALGGNAFATANGAVAIGRDASAGFVNSVAIGLKSTTSEADTVSFGSAIYQRRLVNIAAGTGDNDAVNLGQVTKLITDATKVVAAQSQAVSLAQQTQASAPAPRSLAMLAAPVPNPVSSLTPSQLIVSGPTDKIGQIEALGSDAMAIGLNTHANGDQSVAIGTNTSTGNVGSVAVGNGAISSSAGGTAIGVNAQATNGTNALAVGNFAQAGSNNSIVVGNNSIVADTASTTTDNGISLGNKNVVSGANSLALGNSLTVSGTNTAVLGNNIKSVTGKNSVVLGSGSDGSMDNVVSVGAKGSERRIVNVATGTGDTDAVNVAQLNSAVAAAGGGGLVQQDPTSKVINVATKVDGVAVNFAGTAGARELTGVAAGTGTNSAATVGQLQPVVAALGGGAKVNPDGTVTAPSYTVQGTKQGDVGSALTSLDNGLTSVQAQLNQSGLGLVAQDTPTGSITVGAKTGGTVIDVANKDGVARTITNVAAGGINANSVDAINGSQLYSVGSGLASAIGGGAALNPDGTITQPTFTVGGVPMHNVGDALSNVDGRVTANTSDIAGLQQAVKNIGTGGGGGTANPDAVAYDTSAHNKLTLGTPGSQKTALTNLADGSVAAGSTDAVTGGQLFTTNAKVDDLGNAIKNISSTGSTVIAAGPGAGGDTGPAPTASGPGALAIGNGASATGDNTFAAGNGANASSSGATSIGAGSAAGGKDSLALGHNAQAPADNAVALGANSVADQPNTVSFGTEGNERRLTNVAPGIAGTDAVNMNQLQSGLGDVARKSYGGIAAATALTMIPDVDANKTLSVGIGGGTYRGYAATAIGGTARITQNLKVRVGAGWSSSGTTVGAGASYQW
jgi:autotransporter adhesin